MTLEQYRFMATSKVIPPLFEEVFLTFAQTLSAISSCLQCSAEVQTFIDKDPYVQNGLVTKVDIRPYAVAVRSGLQQVP